MVSVVLRRMVVGGVLCLLWGVVAPWSVARGVVVGEEFGGGIVVEVDSTGQRGLVVSKVDLPGHSAGLLEEGLFTWRDAVQGCRDLVKNGFADWFLPDRKELSLIYGERERIGGFAVDGGDYWSATEESPGSPWFLYFGAGDRGALRGQVVHCRVRPVRRFEVVPVAPPVPVMKPVVGPVVAPAAVDSVAAPGIERVAGEPAVGEPAVAPVPVPADSTGVVR